MRGLIRGGSRDANHAKDREAGAGDDMYGAEGCHAGTGHASVAAGHVLDGRDSLPARGRVVHPDQGNVTRGCEVGLLREARP